MKDIEIPRLLSAKQYKIFQCLMKYNFEVAMMMSGWINLKDKFVRISARVLSTNDRI